MTEWRSYRFPRARFTKLTSCGAYDTGACAMFVTSGVIELALTAEVTERETSVLQDGDGQIIDVATVEAQLQWVNAELTLTGVEPQLVAWLTGDTLLVDDGAVPASIGLGTETSGAANVNVAVEGWSRLLGTACVGTYPGYGYHLLPWLTGGRFVDRTLNKGLMDVKIVGLRTVLNGTWGVGPYTVVRSAAAATLGFPEPLFTAVTGTQPMHAMRTYLAPPLVTPTCTTVAGAALAVVDDDGAGANLDATATLPVGTGLTPGVINWGMRHRWLRRWVRQQRTRMRLPDPTRLPMFHLGSLVPCTPATWSWPDPPSPRRAAVRPAVARRGPPTDWIDR